MIPLMQRELVEKHHWLGAEEFAEQIALCQALPGVFATNMAALTGYRLRGVAGSVVAILGTVLMPVLFILLLASLFAAFRDNEYVDKVFRALRPAAVALVAAAVVQLGRRTPRRGLWVAGVAALLIWLLGASPMLVVLAAAAVGVVWQWQKGGKV